MLEITKEVVKAVNIPVTVKTRLGWDADNRVIVDLAEQLQDCRYRRPLHPRTYTGANVHGRGGLDLDRCRKNNPHANPYHREWRRDFRRDMQAAFRGLWRRRRNDR